MAITTETFTLTGDTTTAFALSFAVWDSGADISAEIDDGTNPVAPAAFTLSSVGTGSTATINVPSASGVSGTLYVYYNPSASGMLGTYTAPMVPVSTLSTEFNGLWTALGLVETATNEALRLNGASPQAYDAAAYAVSSDFTSYGSNGRALVAYDDMMATLSVTNVTTTLGAAGEVLMSNGSAYGPTTTFTAANYTFSGNVIVNEDLKFDDPISYIYVDDSIMVRLENGTIPLVSLIDPSGSTSQLIYSPIFDHGVTDGAMLSIYYGATEVFYFTYNDGLSTTKLYMSGNSHFTTTAGSFVKFDRSSDNKMMLYHDGVRTFKVYNASDNTSYIEMDIDDGNDTRMSLYYNGVSYLDLYSDPNGSTVSSSVSLGIHSSDTLTLKADTAFYVKKLASDKTLISHNAGRDFYIYNGADSTSYVHWNIDDGNDISQEFSYDGVVELTFLADPDLSQVIAKSGLKISSTDAATSIEFDAPYGIIVPSVTAASIASPVNGMIIYDSGTFKGRAAGAWVNLH